MPSSELQGLKVLVTRPAHQAGPLCELIEAAGGEAIRFPLLAVAPLPESSELRERLQHLARYDLAIFISPNAVEFGLAAAVHHGGLPATLPLAAVGAATRRALQQQLGRAVLAPQQRFDSEALLVLPELQQVGGKRILIFRGEGGRELLAETLRERGAQVDYAEVYRRLRPAAPSAETLAVWREAGVNTIVVTSNEALQNLYEMVTGEARGWLLDQQLLVVSERCAVLAHELGFGRVPLLAPGAGDRQIVETLARGASKQAGSVAPESGVS